MYFILVFSHYVISIGFLPTIAKFTLFLHFKVRKAYIGTLPNYNIEKMR